MLPLSFPVFKPSANASVSEPTLGSHTAIQSNTNIIPLLMKRTARLMEGMEGEPANSIVDPDLERLLELIDTGLKVRKMKRRKSVVLGQRCHGHSYCGAIVCVYFGETLERKVKTRREPDNKQG